jgi:hypothetical protein
MLLQKPEVTKEQARQQKQRCARFAAGTADAIGSASDCLFSLLPYQERVRQATSWYDACAQAMLRCNYSPLDEWIREQACRASSENFELHDLLRLLRICRQTAIEIDGWDEDVFSSLDDVINEGLIAIRPKVSWSIPDGLNYLKDANGKPVELAVTTEPESPKFAADTRIGERRYSGRNRLALPIRIRCKTQAFQCDEITLTENVSLTGLYFSSMENYRVGTQLQVTYPYWTDPGGINREYPARVARLDRLPDGSAGIAIEFLQDLRER